MGNNIDIKDGYPSESRSRKVLRVMGMVFVGVIFTVIFALVFGFLVKWLWNYLMPDLFGMRTITYLQAFAMVLLARLLFGAFGAHNTRHPPLRHPRFAKWDYRSMCHDRAPWDDREGREHFRHFWHDEGKEAFEAYVKKIGSERE